MLGQCFLGDADLLLPHACQGAVCGQWDGVVDHALAGMDTYLGDEPAEEISGRRGSTHCLDEELRVPLQLLDLFPGKSVSRRVVASLECVCRGQRRGDVPLGQNGLQDGADDQVRRSVRCAAPAFGTGASRWSA